MAIKKKKGQGKVVWFNEAKGYGMIADKNATIFLDGGVLGGDNYGLNIPKENIVHSDDIVEYTAEYNDRPIFPSTPDLRWYAKSCKKI